MASTARTTRHLICFKQWTTHMVEETIRSACQLKALVGGCSHVTQLDILRGSKIIIINEVNFPVLNASVSKAAHLLGASSTIINDHLDWDGDYYARIFSLMSDTIFVTTSTQHCLQRFADRSLVPVVGMKSRAHSPLRALATVMTVMEHFGTEGRLNFSYIGPYDPVLGSYLVLCPLLGYDIKYKCCRKASPVSPILKNYAESVVKDTQLVTVACEDAAEALKGADVIIAGPARGDKMAEFKITIKDVNKACKPNWIFMHTCPYGPEHDMDLINSDKAKTFNVFQNMIYIAASLMAYAVKRHTF